ncbi:nucleotidyltransferase domain-containing protein [Luteococcus sp. H138]|uniref:nucleotidyltransferase domain-containing protein n=1 Tax=unclassified Luteococcus TaxID=2639923 RepID=UPI00313B8736
MRTDLVWLCKDGIRIEYIGRLRRAAALQAMVVAGRSQAEIAAELGISQPAVSQQLSSGRKALQQASPGDAFEAARPVLRAIAEERGFTDLAVFGSVARGEATDTSDVDLLVTPPQGASLFDLVRLQEEFAQVVGCKVDLVSRNGLQSGRDKDILRDEVLV